MTKNKQQSKVWKGLVLTVPNRHYTVCGKPPELKAGEGYTAYLENYYGEQIVFRYDYRAKTGTLWHGNFGWDEPIHVMGGGTTMILSDEEREWLGLVWKVATKGETKEFQLRSALDLVKAYKAIYDELTAHPEFSKDAFMQRHFSKVKKTLEKQEKALTGQLIEEQVQEAAGGDNDQQ